MFKSYFKIAWRNLRNNKVYSAINIAGLSIGLACAMLILLYVNDEISFDRFVPNVNNIYRIVSKSKSDAGERYSNHTGFLQGPRFSENVPGIEQFIRIQSGHEDIKLNTEIVGEDLLFADSSLFTAFKFPLLSGDPVSCLKAPHSIVLSEDEAIKRFATKDAVGKTIMLKEDSVFVPYKVTAVSKRSPQNSSVQLRIVLPIRQSLEDAKNNENWYSYFLNTFVVLNPAANVNTVNSSMQKFYEKDATAVFKALMDKYGGKNNGMGVYFLQPYTDMHMSTELPAQNGLTNPSNPIYSYILSGLALFVLLIACINFVNLTVARSVKRAKEIGVRKVVGGERKQLIFQFLGESFLLCLIAFSLSILLVAATLPVFNTLANKALSLSYLLEPKLVVGYVALFLITGFLAGFYPALVLSGYKPVDTLYGRFNLKGKNYLQKSLVVLQFALASFLIIATFTIYSQFDFLIKTDLGYDDSNIIQLSKDHISIEEGETFKAELLRNPNIINVALKNGGTWMTGAKVANDSAISFHYETVDENYIPLMKIPLLSGRNFSKDHPDDAVSSVLVNESFVKKAGWKDPIGEMVNFIYQDKEILHVIGVVKDYHSQALTEKIGPQLFTMKRANHYGQYEIKFKAGTETQVLSFLSTTFKTFYHLDPYVYVFKDQQKLKRYESESKWRQIILFGAILTIFISCIGLFGLSVLSAEKKQKEIGIRKVLGASVNNVVAILSKDFVKLVIIALLIAMPASYFAVNKWLENYPYRIQTGWELFTVAAVLVIAIALFTVSFQAFKAAIGNPVKSLRAE